MTTDLPAEYTAACAEAIALAKNVVDGAQVVLTALQVASERPHGLESFRQTIAFGMSELNDIRQLKRWISDVTATWPTQRSQEAVEG